MIHPVMYGDHKVENKIVKSYLYNMSDWKIVNDEPKLKRVGTYGGKFRSRQPVEVIEYNGINKDEKKKTPAGPSRKNRRPAKRKRG